ncbi:hypothetical protein EOD04_38350, partial [Mesorhizobium sp. M2C.T.Ca.TU.009.01.2.1]
MRGDPSGLYPDIGQIGRLDQRGDSAHSIGMNGEQHDFSHLDRAGRATAGVARSPRLAVMLTIGAGIGLAWFLL